MIRAAWRWLWGAVQGRARDEVDAHDPTVAQFRAAGRHARVVRRDALAAAERSRERQRQLPRVNDLHDRLTWPPDDNEGGAP